jgi:magnesium transporter
MAIEINKEFIERIEELIELDEQTTIESLLIDEHPADIAEIMDQLDLNDATYLFKLLDSERTAEVLMEIDEDDRDKILQNLSNKEIADEIDELDTDDAADIIADLPIERKEHVISAIEDKEHAKEIVELLNYKPDTAGGLMAKELVQVNENWNIPKCIKEMRVQAHEITRVHSIYVVDDNDVLKGRLSLKDLLVTSSKSHVSDIYISKVDSVNVNDKAEDVALIMQKYDLEAIPVVDDENHLVGRITIDDIVDFIKEEAEKDYQLAAGISQDVEADDTIWQLTKARLPWLFIGTLGGIGAASIISGFQVVLSKYAELIIFIPLIQATAGNVGVQSSAIVVQGLANNTIKGEILHRLFKEFLLGLINGIALAFVIFLVSKFVFHTDIHISLTIGIALVTVIVNAALVGTFIPIFLDKRGIDPAVATGPFITTTNDVFGILIYFWIAKLILGF